MIPRQQILWQFIRSKGAEMVTKYVEALLLVPPKDVASFYVDVLVQLCSCFMDNGESRGWLEVALALVPITVFTDENKLTLLDILCDQNYRRSALMQEFDLLAKRARSSAVR